MTKYPHSHSGKQQSSHLFINFQDVVQESHVGDVPLCTCYTKCKFFTDKYKKVCDNGSHLSQL